MKRNTVPWYFRIRARILLPSIALFILFAALAIFGSTRQLTQMADRDTLDELRGAGSVLAQLVADAERRVSLHARFVSDMMLLTEKVPETGTGRSILIYILEYSRQEQFLTTVHRVNASGGEPFGRLIRKGLLGIRASELAGSAPNESGAARIAAASPIQRDDGIREVVVSWLELDDQILRDFSRKAGTDLSIFHEGVIVATSLSEELCAQKIEEVLTPEYRQEILAAEDVRTQELECGGEPWKMLFQPVEVGYHKAAIGVVSLSLGRLVEARSRAARNTILAAVALLLLATWGYTAIIRRITRPIRLLSRATRNVDEDGIGQVVTFSSRSEVGELANGYNTMIHRLHESKEELEELHRQEMERADRLATLGELAGGIAHEVRNPLAGISGAMQCFESDIPAEGDKREMYQEVLNQIDRMENLTRDLLDYSRPRTPELSLSDLNTLLERACLLLTIGMKDDAVSIVKMFDPDLPQALVDPEKMQQVFLNILLNCMQAMPDGGGIRVGTSATENGEDSSVQVTITDEGPGMDAETLANALRPFFTTKHTGTGLGLSIARQIVESHGGRLQIDSAPGKGSTFIITLPLQSAPDRSSR